MRWLGVYASLFTARCKELLGLSSSLQEDADIAVGLVVGSGDANQDPRKFSLASDDGTSVTEDSYDIDIESCHLESMCAIYQKSQ